MSSPVAVQGNISFNFDPEFCKQQVNAKIDAAIDVVTPVAQEVMTALVNGTVDNLANPAKSGSKQLLEGYVTEKQSPTAHASIDGCVDGGRECVKKNLIPVHNAGVNSTATIAKTSLKTTAGYSVDATHSLCLRVTTPQAQPAH